MCVYIYIYSSILSHNGMATIIYFGIKRYMFRAVPLSISRTRMELQFHPDLARKLYKPA